LISTAFVAPWFLAVVCNLFQTAKLKWIGAGLGAGASRAGAGWVLSALDYLLGWIGVEVFHKKKGFVWK
jgi:hypothetical protein